MFSFNTVTALWDRKYAPPPFPARAYHTATYLVASREIVVTGGSGEEDVYDDVWAYKVADRRWRMVDIPKCAAPWSPGCCLPRSPFG